MANIQLDAAATILTTRRARGGPVYSRVAPSNPSETSFDAPVRVNSSRVDLARVQMVAE
eukprot:jgi/Pico_ML_1/54591/g487.t1